MAQTDSSVVQTVVLDAGPVIHLDEIDCLHLLTDFKRLLLPEAVSREVEHHRPTVFLRGVFFEKVDVAFDRNIHTVCKLFSLDIGEMEAMSLCFQYPGSVLLTDDASARLAAKTLGIRAYGTIGVLLRAIRRKQLSSSEVITRLEEIHVKSTLFIKHSLLHEIIEEVRSKYDRKT